MRRWMSARSFQLPKSVRLRVTTTSGLRRRRSTGNWDRVTAGQLRLAFDDRILLEYEAVLRRQKFGFPPQRIDALLNIFLLQEAVTASPWPFQPLPDPAAAMFLEVAQTADCQLIAGNVRHFPEERRASVRVMTAPEWLTETN
jgi:predicted nucleic acid-binding protein